MRRRIQEEKKTFLDTGSRPPKADSSGMTSIDVPRPFNINLGGQCPPYFFCVEIAARKPLPQQVGRVVLSSRTAVFFSPLFQASYIPIFPVSLDNGHHGLLPFVAGNKMYAN